MSQQDTPNAPTCTGCGRDCTDWIRVRGVRWTPDLDRTQGEYRCWACRGEPHSAMPKGYVPQAFWDRVREHLESTD